MCCGILQHAKAVCAVQRTIFTCQHSPLSHFAIVTVIIAPMINMSIGQRTTTLLAQHLPHAENNAVIHEVSHDVKENNTAERTFDVFGEIDGNLVLVFLRNRVFCWRCCASRISWFSAELHWIKPSETTPHCITVLFLQLQQSRSKVHVLPILSSGRRCSRLP